MKYSGFPSWGYDGEGFVGKIDSVTDMQSQAPALGRKEIKIVIIHSTPVQTKRSEQLPLNLDQLVSSLEAVSPQLFSRSAYNVEKADAVLNHAIHR